MLNQKFIVEWMVEPKYNPGKVNLSIGGNEEKIKDLVKVICSLEGVNYNEQTRLRDFFNNFNGLETNTWYCWSFFEIKAFKKGTMHLKFQNKDVWYRLNKAYGEIKGFNLPEAYKR